LERGRECPEKKGRNLGKRETQNLLKKTFH